MADTGYFDNVSSNLKAGIGAQAEGIANGVKVNLAAGVSPSVNAHDTGVKAVIAGACPTGCCPWITASMARDVKANPEVRWFVGKRS